MSVRLSDAIDGYFLHARARGLATTTIKTYRRILEKFARFLEDDPFIDQITVQDIEAFFVDNEDLANQTLAHYHTTLSALWTWASEKAYPPLVDDHIIHRVTKPRGEQRLIVPLNKKEVRAILEALEESLPYSRPGHKTATNTLSTALRHRAIILLMLDTGLRASEVCGLRIYQCDLKHQRIRVMGKGAKEREVRFSARTGQAIWRYLATRLEDNAGDPLFATSSGRPLDRRYLYNIFARIGDRAGVHFHPHQLRHTFAIQYLRNGGNPYTLQAILGHSTMEMTRRYLNLAQIDLDESMKRASPVENWNL